MVAAAAMQVSAFDLVGVTVSRPVDDITAQVRRLASGACDLVGSAFAYRAQRPAEADIGASAHLVGKGSLVTEVPVDIRDGWIGPGYGVASPAGDQAAGLLARTESVFLDPVFGAKAMAALIDACRSGAVTEPVAFLVSGGAPTLFTGSAGR
jgi:D-cysteine desulfhydrase